MTKVKLNIIIALLVNAIFCTQLLAKDYSKICIETSDKLKNDLNFLQTNFLNSAENLFFKSAGKDLEYDFKKMKAVGCKTNASEDRVENMLKVFSKKHKNKVQEMKISGWRLDLTSVSRIHSTVERTVEAEKRLKENPLDLFSQAGSYGITVIKMSRKIEVDGRILEVTKYIEPCSNAHTRIKLKVDTQSEFGKHTIDESIGGEFDIRNTILPKECRSEREKKNEELLFGSPDRPSISEISKISTFLQIPRKEKLGILRKIGNQKTIAGTNKAIDE